MDNLDNLFGVMWFRTAEPHSVMWKWNRRFTWMRGRRFWGSSMSNRHLHNNYYNDNYDYHYDYNNNDDYHHYNDYHHYDYHYNFNNHYHDYHFINYDYDYTSYYDKINNNNQRKNRLFWRIERWLFSLLWRYSSMFIISNYDRKSSVTFYTTDSILF